MTIQSLEAIPANSNPFHYNAYHMGQEIGKNHTMMFENHAHEECNYLIIIDKRTGERNKILL